MPPFFPFFFFFFLKKNCKVNIYTVFRLNYIFLKSFISISVDIISLLFWNFIVVIYAQNHLIFFLLQIPYSYLKRSCHFQSGSPSKHADLLFLHWYRKGDGIMDESHVRCCPGTDRTCEKVKACRKNNGDFHLHFIPCLVSMSLS